MNAALMKSAGISVTGCSLAIHVHERYIDPEGPRREFSADRFRAITHLWKSADPEMHNAMICSFTSDAPLVTLQRY